MLDLEDLDVVVLHQGAALPDIFIDLEDADGDDVDLSVGYDTFSAKIITEAGQDAGVSGLTVSGVSSGFKIEIDAGGLGLNAGEYLIQAVGQRTEDAKPRYGYCRLALLTGF